MAPITRIGGSFAVVLVAYWAYALVAVPLIEPPASRLRADQTPSEEQFNQWARQSQERSRRELSGLFPPGSWELEKNPTILEIDQIKLLFLEYSRLDDGKKVKIHPCTMIFTPEDAGATADERMRRSVILEAPGGAVMEFDQPFELQRAKVGRLQSGELKGPITIRSQGKSPGPEDDLRLETSDVDLNEQRVYTPNPVQFQFGPNRGQGSELTIKFLADPNGGSSKRGPNVDGIELIELRHLERLHLEWGDEGFVPGLDKPGEPAAAPTAKPPEAPKQGALPPGQGRAGEAANLPIEITCRGPFRIDPIQQVATFEDQVDVHRIHPQGLADQLNCERLGVFFARPRDAMPTASKDGPAPPKRRRPRKLDLVPRRVEATGTPVDLHAPSQGIHARGERLEYDVQSRQVVLNGTQEVYLKQGPNEIHARRLSYQLGEGRRLGQAAAEGPGWLRATLDDKPERQLFARWGKRLQLGPYEGQPLVWLTGGAELSSGDLGRLNAGEICFWLFEMPPAEPNGQWRYRPDRMVAKHQVRLDSPQLSGEVDELQIWLEPMPEAAAGGPTAGTAAGNGSANGPRPPAAPAGRVLGVRPVGEGAVSLPVGLVGASTSAEASLLPGAGQRAPARPQNHFKITGRLLQARVLAPGDLASRDAQPEVAELTIEGNVELVETRTARPDEAPVVVRGDLVEVVHANQPDRAVTITGSPPSFAGRGLTLSGLNTGSSIKLDCGANELRLDEPGWMELPMDRDFQGRPLAEPGRLQVRWQQGMTFDGRTVRFEGDVVAAGQQRQSQSDLATKTLQVRLVRTIRFAELEGEPDRPEVERIVCLGGLEGVLLENRSFDERGLVSIDRMEVPNLDVNLTGGESKAGGPGWMTSICRGSTDLAALGGASPNAAAPSPAADARATDDDGLTYLHVRFQGGLEGNVELRQMKFRDRVQAVHTPVDSWEPTVDPDDLEALGPRGVILSCRELGVTEMPKPVGGGRAIELAAMGNVVVEGRTFTARAPRMTYESAKQLLILEGEGWTEAEIYYQKQVGAPWSEFKGRRIRYDHATGQAFFDDARSIKAN